MAIAAAVFVLVLTIIFGGYWMFVLRTEQREEGALRKRLKTRRVSGVGPTVVKARERLSAVWLLDSALSRSQAAIAPLQRAIAQSGLEITVGIVLLTSLLLGLVALALVAYVGKSWLWGLAAGPIAAFLPFLYVRRAARKRLATFEEQFPEAIDLIARSLRAGHALTTALQTVGEEIQDPVGGEFQQVFEEQNYGMSLVDALKAFADRIPILDARFFVTAVLTQRESGGNLSEVLDNLASVVRERFKVKRQVRVVSAHGRITGWVLGFLPPALALILFVISPQHMRLLLDDPLGVQMLLAAILLQVVGILIIRRIVDVEY